jgi:hypothetical protein
VRPVVELTIGEVAVAHHIAVLRQAINREAGKVNLKAGPQDVMTTEVVGVKAELAFCRWANVYPDLSVHLRAGSFDARWLGWNVDVKGTRNPDGPLYVDARQGKTPDVYVLAHVGELEVTLCGWLDQRTAMLATPTETKTGVARIIPQRDLRAMDVLPKPRKASVPTAVDGVA